MESKPQNTEYRKNPGNFHTCNIIDAGLTGNQWVHKWDHSVNSAKKTLCVLKGARVLIRLNTVVKKLN